MKTKMEPNSKIKAKTEMKTKTEPNSKMKAKT